MEENEILRKALTEHAYSTGRVGKPKLRWEDDMSYDANRILGPGTEEQLQLIKTTGKEC